MLLSNLFWTPKYDVAISVAKEDIIVAEQIAAALRDNKIRYYLFTDPEHEDEDWGTHIIVQTLKVFGKDSRYVLLITSKIFQNQYWANTERMIAMHYLSKKKPVILQLKLDDAEIDGIERDTIYKEWNDNPNEIAAAIKRRLVKDWRHQFKLRIASCLFLVIVGLTGFRIYNRKADFNYDQNNKAVEHSSTSEISPTTTNRSKKMLIQGGSFLMGYKDNSNKEAPSHNVMIHSFNINPTEVTIDQYLEYCRIKKIPLPPQPYGRNHGSYPVVNVSWFEAKAYCEWIAGRLPTEAEWEYAAGAGLGTRYSGGNNAQQRAVYNRVKPCEVGTRLPNAFGLYDMSGNVAEWCNDWFDSSYYHRKSEIVDPRGPPSGVEKVVRGGAYNSTINPENTLHISFRDKELPDLRKPYIGFRVVWDK